MRYENLLEPISDDLPCGPDLEAEDDGDFIDYYYEAETRMPDRFVDLDTGKAFDRRNIDLKSEVAQIEALLKKSVDLRLLVTEAKFQALAGKLIGFSEVVQIIAKLLEVRWDDVHPKVDNGEVDRRNQLENLADVKHVIMPLQMAPLVKDRRIDEISLRSMQVARAEKEPRTDETVGDAGAMQSALRSADNAEAVEASYNAVTGAQAALNAISLSCMTAERGSFSPTLRGLTELLDEMLTLLNEARPDLSGEEGDSTEEADTVEALDEAGEGETVMVAARPAGEVPHHAAARAALLAVEIYFARHEPSAPGLLLIRQARHLIGAPLTEALDTLLPKVADNAIIDFGTDSGFRMDARKLRDLAADIGDVQSALTEPEDIPEYAADNRGEAMALVGKVESFFRQVEPSSPVPVLLFKAKNYMNRDFSAIVSELFAER